MVSTDTAPPRHGRICGAAPTAGDGAGLQHGHAAVATGGRAAAATGGRVGVAVWPRVPRGRLARAVLQRLRSSSPTFLVRHCHRSFQLALLLAAAQGLHIDAEVLWAGVLLHDLGRTPTYHAPDVRFEVASANAARALVLEHGMARRRAGNVWDVAALHGTGGISDVKNPETAVGAAGIGADVTGLGLEQLDLDDHRRRRPPPRIPAVLDRCRKSQVSVAALLIGRPVWTYTWPRV